VYREVLDSLDRNWSARGRVDRLEVAGVTMVDLRGRTKPLSKLLAETVAAGKYEFSPLKAVTAHIEGKQRTLFRPTLLDRVVLTLTARYLVAISESFLSPTVHSYRKGHSPWKAIDAFSGYLQRHHAKVPTKARGLFVLHRDIRKYGESIPIHADSPLWSVLKAVAVADSDGARRALGMQLVTAAILQPIQSPNGEICIPTHGIPTGSPIQPPCANLYLSAIDAACSSIAGGFYSRFGDDILFCHPDEEVASDTSQQIDTLLTKLGLTSKPEKRIDLDFNGAGRKRSLHTQFRPSQSVEYLGAAIDFSGRVGLKLEKARRLERDLRFRLRHVARELATFERDVKAEELCGAVRTALRSNDVLALGAADFLSHRATNRSQLRDLDYRIGLVVAECASGHHGPRAFRHVTFRTLRRMGLPSLVAQRNRVAGLTREKT
jgi:retron-type reverse transcriptase